MLTIAISIVWRPHTYVPLLHGQHAASLVARLCPPNLEALLWWSHLNNDATWFGTLLARSFRSQEWSVLHHWGQELAGEYLQHYVIQWRTGQSMHQWYPCLLIGMHCLCMFHPSTVLVPCMEVYIDSTRCSLSSWSNAVQIGIHLFPFTQPQKVCSQRILSNNSTLSMISPVYHMWKQLLYEVYWVVHAPIRVSVAWTSINNYESSKATKLAWSRHLITQHY